MKHHHPTRAAAKAFTLGSAAFFAVLFMANPAFAEDIRNFGEFFSIFDPSVGGKVDDMSVGWLRMTFGDPIRDEEATTLIGFALGRLNAAILAIGSMVLAYKIVVGIMQTAHDGSILGRRWSTLWGPTRVAIGAAALVPLASGLCLAQALVLMIATMGVGLANHAWQVSLDGVLKYGKPLVAPRATSKADFAQQVFDVALCVQVFNAIYREKAEAAAGTPQAAAFPDVDEPAGLREPVQLTSGGGGNTEFSNAYLGANWMRTPVGVHPDIGARGRSAGAYSDICGAIEMPGGLSGSLTGGGFGTLQIDQPFWPWNDVSVEGEDREAIDLQRVRIQAIRSGTSVTHGTGLISMLTSMNGIAERIALNEVAGMAEVQAPNPQDALTAIRTYDNAVAGAVADLFNEVRGDALAELEIAAMSDGWVNVGAWYQHIAGFNASIAQVAKSTPEIGPVQWGQLYALLDERNTGTDPISRARLAGNDLWAGVRGLSRSADDVRDAADMFEDLQPLLDTSVPEPGSQLGDFGRMIWAEFGEMINGMKASFRGFVMEGADVNNYEDAGNPLGVIQRTGISLEGVAVAMITGGVIGNAAAQLAQAFLTLSPGGRIAATAVDKIATFVAQVGVFLLIPALIMGYLVPMMPWVLWISALIGWFILVCEAVIAAPLWALSHMRMDGEGLAGPLGEKGYFLLLSMLLRPVLMVIGFILGMVMFTIFAGATATGFDMATAANYGTDGAGIVGTVFLFAILGGMYIWMAYKSFSLIHVVPDRILRWIGQGGEGLGEQEGMDQTKIIAMAAMHQMSGGMGGLVRSAAGARLGGGNRMEQLSQAAKVRAGGKGGPGGAGQRASQTATQVTGAKQNTRQS